MTIEINHRNSDNNDSEYEWEIYSTNMEESKLIKNLGLIGPVLKVSSDTGVWLPKGVHAALAGEVATSLAALDEHSFQVLVEQCRRPTPVAVCLVTHDPHGNILAVSRKKDFHKPESDWRFGLPGGKVDPGEDAITALVREVKEETGFDIEDPAFIFESICPGRVTYVSRFYSAKVSGTAHTTEPLHIRWVDPEALLDGPFAFSIGRLFRHLELSVHGS